MMNAACEVCEFNTASDLKNSGEFPENTIIPSLLRETRIRARAQSSMPLRD